MNNTVLYTAIGWRIEGALALFNKSGNVDSSALLRLKYIDVGGVTLLKSASKNYKRIIIVCQPEDYDLVVSELENNGDVSLKTRKYLMKKAFNTLCDYDNEIRDYINSTI